MAAVFLKLLNLSISASWLVLAVLVLRLISKRSPKWVNVLLWGIVALRLVLPFSIESALSLIPSAETVSPAAVQFAPAPTITSGVSVIDNAVNSSLSEHFAAVPTASVNPLYVWTEIAGWVWLIGLGAMLLYALVSYLRLRRRVSVSLPIRDRIYLCDAISSPFILGVVKPHIYLPSGLDEVQRQNVLAHEQAHLARRDHWWKPLGFALLAVYWFNPVLWLAYTLLCRDIELACDERVIRTMDESAVKTYSTVLLACSMPRKAVITCPLAFGEVGVKERVKNALHYKKPAFWVVAASVAVCVVVAVCFLTDPPTDTDAAGLVGFHREQVTYADVTDASGAQPSSVQLTAEETDAVYALLDALQYKRLGAASAMEDCYARLYFISAAGERCEIMLSEREMLVNPITGGKTARLYELHSGSAELRDYLFGCIGASEPAEKEMKTMTEPTLSLTLTVPAAWEDIAELSACDKGTAYLGYGIMLFHLSEKNALAAYPDGGMGNVWWLVAMSWDNFKELRGYDALPVPEILGIAEYVLGADDEYVYLLVLPSDVQFLENDPVSQRQYETLQSDSQGVLTRFLKDNGIHINDMCPASSVFSPPARGDAASTTGYAAYDALLAEISDLRRSGASEAQTDFSHDLLSANDYYQTPGWLLRDLDGDGIPELLLGADWGDGHSVIFNIYRLDGAKAVRVVDGWNRSRWYLCTDGSLANEGSSSAFESSYSYYRYTSGELQHLETLLYLDGGSGGSPWRYSVTTDQYVSSGDFHSVTEAEATAVMDKYTHETLILTPFVV
ncbi:M56 family metallopeptidase [Hominenteromicrobium sp.]|uniref:M56 family metallopeptidase n=2 Tax=Oscillospiraceae TaxID=216572 RepID=UPI003A94B0A0